MTNLPPPPPGAPAPGYPVPGSAPGHPVPAGGGYPPPGSYPAPGSYPTPAGPPPPGTPGGGSRGGGSPYPGQVVGNPRPAGPSFNVPPPVGKVRGTFAVMLWSVLTVGIYFMVWNGKVFKELRIHNGGGPGGGIGFFSAGGIGLFLTPSIVADTYRRAGSEPPVTSMAGWWSVLLPLIGWFVWVAKVNGALNAYWRSRGAT